MAIGVNRLKQYVVEFISDPTIGGIYTNGIRNSQSTNGPWNWIVPDDVVLLKADLLAGGSGGGAGWNSGTAQAGGGGGACGPGIQGMEINVIPNATLVITIGSGGNGGIAGGSFATDGGRTTITGLTRPYWWRGTFVADNIIDVGTQYGGAGYSATDAGSGSGGANGNNFVLNSGGVNNATSNINNNGADFCPPGGDSNLSPLLYGGRFWTKGGAGGGAAHSTTGSIAGGNGGGFTVGGDVYNAQFIEGGGFEGAGAGNTTGSISRGGGGAGGHSFISFGGKGGAGGAAGSDAGIGAGGGGGGGGANGGKGGNGYVRFVYWSAT